MPIDIRKFTALKDKAEKQQREADKAAGALEQTLSKLKEEFDCDSLKEAKTILTELESEEAELSEQFNRELKQLEEKWEGKL